jgi:hypothetical protein
VALDESITARSWETLLLCVRGQIGGQQPHMESLCWLAAACKGEAVVLHYTSQFTVRIRPLHYQSRNGALH